MSKRKARIKERIRDYEALTRMLPTEAYYKGMTLTWWAPEALGIPTDPVILRFRDRELYRWDYIPSLTEVFEVCKELEARDGG